MSFLSDIYFELTSFSSFYLSIILIGLSATMAGDILSDSGLF